MWGVQNEYVSPRGWNNSIYFVVWKMHSRHLVLTVIGLLSLIIMVLLTLWICSKKSKGMRCDLYLDMYGSKLNTSIIWFVSMVPILIEHCHQGCFLNTFEIEVARLLLFSTPTVWQRCVLNVLCLLGHLKYQTNAVQWYHEFFKHCIIYTIFK